MDYETIPFHKDCTQYQIEAVIQFLHYRALKVLGHDKYEIKEMPHEKCNSLITLGWYECSQ